MHLSYLDSYVFSSARTQSESLSAPKPPGRGAQVQGGLQAFVEANRDKTEGMRGTSSGCGDRWAFTGSEEWGGVGVADYFFLF